MVLAGVTTSLMIWSRHNLTCPEQHGGVLHFFLRARRSWSQIQTSAQDLCEVCMFSLSLHGFFLGNPASSHSPKRKVQEISSNGIHINFKRKVCADVKIVSIEIYCNTSIFFCHWEIICIFEIYI